MDTYTEIAREVSNHCVCLNCGEEIATARLLEMPEAPLCSACA